MTACAFVGGASPVDDLAVRNRLQSSGALVWSALVADMLGCSTNPAGDVLISGYAVGWPSTWLNLYDADGNLLHSWSPGAVLFACCMTPALAIGGGVDVAGVRVWSYNLADYSPAWSASSPTDCVVALAASLTHLYVGDIAGVVRKFALADGAEVTSGGWPWQAIGIGPKVRGLAVSMDQTRLAVCGVNMNPSCNVISTADASSVWDYDTGANARAVSYDINGRLAVVGVASGGYTCWVLDTAGNLIGRYNHGDTVRGCAFNRTGDLFICGASVAGITERRLNASAIVAPAPFTMSALWSQAHGTQMEAAACEPGTVGVFPGGLLLRDRKKQGGRL